MLAYPELTPEVAAFQLSNLYPQFSYEQTLLATRLIQRVKETVEEAEHGKK
jgi:hypothetical protein